MIRWLVDSETESASWAGSDSGVQPAALKLLFERSAGCNGIKSVHTVQGFLFQLQLQS